MQPIITQQEQTISYAADFAKNVKMENCTIRNCAFFIATNWLKEMPDKIECIQHEHPKPIILTREDREDCEERNMHAQMYWIATTGEPFKEFSPYTDEL